jgi:hypothetical protein
MDPVPEQELAYRRHHIREALERLQERPQRGQGVGPPRKIGDADLLALTAQGLSFARIARLRRLNEKSVRKRLARLKAKGLPIPSRRPRQPGGSDGGQ